MHTHLHKFKRVFQIYDLSGTDLLKRMQSICICIQESFNYQNLIKVFNYISTVQYRFTKNPVLNAGGSYL